jgi:flavin-dependent dehydrogenase
VSQNCDVLVIGGGPAGSITALRLTRLGFDVRLIEAGVFPRSHVGEAISEGVRRQLSHLGIESVLEQSGLQAFETCEERWTDGSLAPRSSPPGAATVNRSLFDAALLDQCRAEGVHVSLGRRARRLHRQDEGWTATITGAPPCRTDYVVDATGRRGILPKARRRCGARTIALFGYWQGSGLPRNPRVSAGEASWAWGAPVTGLGYNVTLFLDHLTIAQGAGDLRGTYFQGIEETAILDRPPSMTRCSEISACDATAWFDEKCAGRDFIKVGEAAQSLDPLASMGVQKAIQMAGSAAIVANTSLRQPSSWSIAECFYRERIQRSAEAHAQAVAEIYAGCEFAAKPFWARRAAPGVAKKEIPAGISPPIPHSATPIRIDASRLTDHPCLCGDFVEMRPAVLAGPDRDPVAYLGDLSIADLIPAIRQSSTFGDLQTRIGARASGGASGSMAIWLLRNGIVRTG